MARGNLLRIWRTKAYDELFFFHIVNLRLSYCMQLVTVLDVRYACIASVSLMYVFNVPWSAIRFC